MWRKIILVAFYAIETKSGCQTDLRFLHMLGRMVVGTANSRVHPFPFPDKQVPHMLGRQ